MGKRFVRIIHCTKPDTSLINNNDIIKVSAFMVMSLIKSSLLNTNSIRNIKIYSNEDMYCSKINIAMQIILNFPYDYIPVYQSKISLSTNFICRLNSEFNSNSLTFISIFKIN